jgi:maltooligosyltrehalose trehalohydrolase
MTRRQPIGAEPQNDGATNFRVWAPKRAQVEVVIDSQATALTSEPDGYFSGSAPAPPGARYRFRLDGGESFPDPASRFQPEGPHGPSEVIDPAFPWTDAGWKGVSRRGQVVYEMHIGTFTREGTWEAAQRELAELARIGITIVEVMPVADFPGRFGWGYDGVGFFAPVALYGRPDDFRRFVDEAHRVGIGVVLDVVYNHFGPDGNYLMQYSDDYFTSRYKNEWGEAINYDGENSGPVREFVTTNASYWALEYHLDGLRLDATQQIFDASPENIMTALGKAVRACTGRGIWIAAENESQESSLARPVAQGGYGLDSLWNDDFHHAALVAVTGRSEAYYTDYRGTPQELISAVKHGYLYQGQYYSWQSKRRGTPAWGIAPEQFVAYLQNHDQVANSGMGERLHQLTSPGRLKALTALLLLAPSTPMLFQGQEFAASSPFLFFADHEPGLARLVHLGRIEFLSQFRSLGRPEMFSRFRDPAELSTMERCKLDFNERRTHGHVYQLHEDLLRLRREDPVFAGSSRTGLDGAVLAAEAFVLRFSGADAGDRLLLVNLGRGLTLGFAAEPLLAPPDGKVWALAWSSEHPDYGGSGTPDVDTATGWRIPPHAAVVMRDSEPVPCQI